MNEYISQKGKLSEKEVLLILEQIVKIVYSLYETGYWHRNLRADHLVKVGNIWKLESLVFNLETNSEGLHSEYSHSVSHQPPEAYDKSRGFT